MSIQADKNEEGKDVCPGCGSPIVYQGDVWFVKIAVRQVVVKDERRRH